MSSSGYKNDLLSSALKMIAEDSPETLIPFTRLHNITSQQTAIFKDESLYPHFNHEQL
jgi:hypothetical protein